MNDTDVYVSPSRVPAGIALLLTVVGAAAMGISFFLGIPAALDASGSGAGIYVWIFAAGGGLVLLGLVLSIICLVQRRARGIAGLALVIALAVIVALVVIRTSATA